MAFGLSENLTLLSSNIIAIAGILFISFLADVVTKKFLLKALKNYISKSTYKWDDILLEKKFFEQISHIVPVIVIHAFAPVFPVYQSIIQRLAFSLVIFIILLSADKLLDAVDIIYRNFEVSRSKPIKGYLQLIKIFAYIIGIIAIISVLIERSPWLLLSGIGAATAVLMLIFQNSILGFVASIQLAANHMVKIGDWIEIPAYGTSGNVIDMSLHTVKILNFDNTITTVPTHALISGSFKNWRGMQESGGRRIMRSVYIDMTSIKFCDEEMLSRFKKIQYMGEYLDNKLKEIDSYNKTHNIDPSTIVNGRHLTNIGVFRAYLMYYLANHPHVHKGMTKMVRQLQPTENGLPMEIYVFANDTNWVNYETIQSDIFDHILAVIPEFDLRIFQNPSGYDIRSLISDKKQAECKTTETY